MELLPAQPRGSAARAVAGLFELRLGDDLRQVARQAVDWAVGSGALVPAALAVAAVGARYAAYRSRRRRRAGRPRYTLLAATERRQVVLAYGRLMRHLSHDVAPREAGDTASGYFARLAERFPSLKEDVAQVHALVNEAADRPVPPDGSRADAILERLRATGRRLATQAGEGGGPSRAAPRAPRDDRGAARASASTCNHNARLASAASGRSLSSPRPSGTACGLWNRSWLTGLRDLSQDFRRPH